MLTVLCFRSCPSFSQPPATEMHDVQAANLWSGTITLPDSGPSGGGATGEIEPYAVVRVSIPDLTEEDQR